MLREVALLDERDSGDLPVRAREVLDDLPPHPAQRLAAPVRDFVLLQHKLFARRAPHVLLDDPAVRPCSAQRSQIDAHFLREPAHERRCLDPVRRGRFVLLQHNLFGARAGSGSGCGGSRRGGFVAVGAVSRPGRCRRGRPGPRRRGCARPCRPPGDGISTVVLSVWISTSGASSAISSPSATSQRAISPSVSPSPRSGSLNSYAIGG